MIETLPKLQGAHRLDHVGFLAKDIQRGSETMSQLFGIEAWSDEIIDPLQDVKARFGRSQQGLVFELLEPLSAESPIHNSVKKQTNLIHHVAFRTADLDVSTVVMREARAMPIGQPKEGVAFDNARIQFFLLSDGWLVELIEQSKPTMSFPNPVSLKVVQ